MNHVKAIFKFQQQATFEILKLRLPRPKRALTLHFYFVPLILVCAPPYQMLLRNRKITYKLNFELSSAELNLNCIIKKVLYPHCIYVYTRIYVYIRIYPAALQ